MRSTRSCEGAATEATRRFQAGGLCKERGRRHRVRSERNSQCSAAAIRDQHPPTAFGQRIQFLIAYAM